MISIGSIKILDYVNRNENQYPSKIAKNLDITYSHVVKVLIYCEKMGYVKSVKYNRIKEFNITEKGKELANACNVIVRYLK